MRTSEGCIALPLPALHKLSCARPQPLCSDPTSTRCCCIVTPLLVAALTSVVVPQTLVTEPALMPDGMRGIAVRSSVLNLLCDPAIACNACGTGCNKSVTLFVLISAKTVTNELLQVLSCLTPVQQFPLCALLAGRAREWCTACILQSKLLTQQACCTQMTLTMVVDASAWVWGARGAAERVLLRDATAACDAWCAWCDRHLAAALREGRVRPRKPLQHRKVLQIIPEMKCDAPCCISVQNPSAAGKAENLTDCYLLRH